MKALFAAWLLAVGVAGCGLFGKSEEQTLEEVKTKGSPGRPEITVGELDQMARNYSDRLVARVSTACDRIKDRAPDEPTRLKAHQLKLSIALAAYDIVTSPGGAPHIPDAAQHLLDLTILSELLALRWVDEEAAREEFGDEGAGRLTGALSKGREDAWQLAARVMKQDQVDRLKTLILEWRRQNQDVEWLARIRFDVIARGKEGADLAKTLGEAFNPVQPAAKAIDEARITAQQILFYIKRLPTILDWTAEAMVADAVAVPKVSSLLQSLTGSLRSVAGVAEILRQLAEPSSQEPAINSTIREVRDDLVQAKELVQEIRELEAAVQPLLEKSSMKAPPKNANGTDKPTDYEAVASRVDDVARDATSLVRETRALAESPEAMRNLDDVLARASRDVSRSGREVVDHATWRLVEIVILIVVLAAAYKFVAFLVKRRRTRSA